MNTWHKQRSKKEAAFIWAVWNKAVAVNLGEPKQTALRLKAASYGWEEEESIMHRFWDYIHARRAWGFTNKIINSVVYGSACPETLSSSRKLRTDPGALIYYQFLWCREIGGDMLSWAMISNDKCKEVPESHGMTCSAKLRGKQPMTSLLMLSSTGERPLGGTPQKQFNSKGFNGF
ncbi:unnamed protein product [Sphagnum troendelagicum]